MRTLTTSKAFRLNAKRLWLTYPQVDSKLLDKAAILEQLKTIINTTHIEFYLIAEELCQGGNTDFHVILVLNKRINTFNPNKLDLVYSSKTFHGNYQTCKNLEKAIEYATKDKNYITNFELNTKGKLLTFEEKLLNLALKDGIHKAMDYLHENKPEIITKQYCKIKQNLQARLDDIHEGYIKLSQRKTPPKIK